MRWWLHPLADVSARWSLVCASWLHHGDHSLALLSWFTATKKNLNLGCLPPFTLVCALLAAPYRNAVLHHCESWKVFGATFCSLGKKFPFGAPCLATPALCWSDNLYQGYERDEVCLVHLGVGHCVWWCLDRLEAIGQPAGDFTPLFPLLRPSAGVRRLVAPFLTRVLA